MAPVADCGNNQFSVNVDVTYLGDGTTLSLTDDFGNSNNNVTATGIVNMGPYPTGSTVNFTLTNATCEFTGATYFYCPPANDELGGAFPLSINTDDTCTLLTSATNAGAIESITNPTSCTNVATNDVWFSFVASSNSLILEYLNIVATIGSGGTIQATELLEGTDGNLTSLECFITNYLVLNNLTIGNTYYLRNSTRLEGEYAQNYDICLKEAPAAPSNDECLNATALTVSDDDQCNNQITGTTTGATLSSDNTCDTSGYADVWYVFSPTTTGVYEFKYERLSTTPSSSYAIFEGACGTLTQKSSTCNSTSNQIFTLNSGTDYYVMVRSSLTGPGVDFNLCVWQLPPAQVNNDCSAPTTLLESSNSNGNNTITGNLENSYPSPEACSTSYKSIWYSFTPAYTGLYNFDFTRVSGSAYYAVYNTDDCSQTSNNYAPGFSSCYNSGDKTSDLVAGTTYLISVHVSATSSAEFALFAYPDPSLGVESIRF